MTAELSLVSEATFSEVGSHLLFAILIALLSTTNSSPVQLLMSETIYLLLTIILAVVSTASGPAFAEVGSHLLVDNHACYTVHGQKSRIC